MKKKCLQCNKEFTKPINESKKIWQFRHKFCSKQCAYLFRNKGKRKANCLNCKKVFNVKYKKGMYCSRTCKNRMYRGGINLNVAKMIRSNFKYTKWRSDVFTRDNWTCQTCGIVGISLEAHHKVSFAQIIKNEKINCVDMINNKSRLWDINNGVTLCKSCHKLTDSYMKRLNIKMA